MRFGTKHVFVAIFIAAVGLTAYLLLEQHQKRLVIARIFGSIDTYEVLRSSRSFDVFRVITSERPNAVDWNVPPADSLTFVRAESSGDAYRLRELLISTADPAGVTKDFIFGPSFMLQYGDNSRQFQIYFDFESKEAAIVVGGKVNYFFAIDSNSEAIKGHLQKPTETRTRSPQ